MIFGRDVSRYNTSNEEDDMDDTSDSRGTGEHLTAGKDPRIRPNEDRGADRVVGPGEAGLGTGLDEAEKARVDPVKKPKR